MMLEILETGKALYALAAICILGLLSRVMARSLYKRLIRETDNMTLTKNRYLRELKQKAENAYRLNQGIQNTEAYLEKQLMNYRFFGLTLNGWGNLSNQFTVLCFLAGGTAAFLSYWYRCDNYYIVLYGTVGILAGLFTLFVDCGVNLTERKLQLLNALQDYLENSLFHRLSRETASAMEGNMRESARGGLRENGIREGGRSGGIRELNIRDLTITDNEEQDKLNGEGIRNISARDRARGERAKAERVKSERAKADNAQKGTIVELEEGEEAAEQSSKKSGRLVKRNQKEEPENQMDYLKRSLEQIAASREKNQGDGDWIKELSSDELELVDEILKQYLV